MSARRPHLHLPDRASLAGHYPHQVWVLFWGSLISMTGQSLVWPFLTIFIRQQLGLPLSEITLLFTVQTIAALAGTAVAGPAMDRFGRKWGMVLGLAGSGTTLIVMTGAETFLAWGALLSLYALTGVLFRIGSQAMIADLLPSEERVGAYALLRTAYNVGIAVGPAVGGLLIALSYDLSFLIAALVQIGMGVAIVFVIRETLPRDDGNPSLVIRGFSLGYGPVLRDRPFMSFWGVYLLVELAASLVFTLLAVYVKEQYAIPEDQYGWILTTNAAMVVLFQYAVTRITRRYSALPVMAVSGLFYAAGLAIYALSTGFAGFWVGMVVMTIGELIISPTSTALVADLAPADMRARYMGLYSLSYRVSGGVGPVLGGVLNDHVAPAATWWFGSLAALLSAGGFILMGRSRAFRASTAPDPAPAVESADR
jgi:MFS family permease